MRILIPLALLAACKSVPGDVEVIRINKPSAVIDCNGKPYKGGAPVEIRVLADFVQIRDCQITGSIRTIGMARTGEGEELKQSSRKKGHTVRAQAVAPSNVTIKGVRFQSVGLIPVYAGPGTVSLSVLDSTFEGWSKNTAIYLDAESAKNIIEGNIFRMENGREVIAVDASAENTISDNRFEGQSTGGIYLYRNCGEGGTVRHQTPSYNVIKGNTFKSVGSGEYIHINSRNGNRDYCDDDKGYPFGSSVDNRDLGVSNIVRDNYSGQTKIKARID